MLLSFKLDIVSNLHFADDVVLISEKMEELQQNDRELNTYEQAGLEINVTKTKQKFWIFTKKNSRTLEYICIDAIIYLRYWICFNKESEKEIEESRLHRNTSGHEKVSLKVYI